MALRKRLTSFNTTYVLKKPSWTPVLANAYATHTSTSSGRRQVTVANDSGQVPWTDLSGREKAARTTQQTFNLSVVLVGAAMTAGVAYFLYDAVFSPDSKTTYFNRAFEEVKASSECRELLGPIKSMYAYGEPSGNRWTRNRPIASTTFKDARGVEHMHVKFYIKGERAEGTVRCEMARSRPEDTFEYRLLSLEVPGELV